MQLTFSGGIAMTKNEITADLRRFCGGGFVTRSQLAQFLGYASPKRVDRFLEGLDRISGTRYFINDVAERLLMYRE